ALWSCWTTTTLQSGSSSPTWPQSKAPPHTMAARTTAQARVSKRSRTLPNDTHSNVVAVCADVKPDGAAASAIRIGTSATSPGSFRIAYGSSGNRTQCDFRLRTRFATRTATSGTRNRTYATRIDTLLFPYRTSAD